MNSQPSVQEVTSSFAGVVKEIRSHLAGRDHLVQALIGCWERAVDRQLEAERFIVELGGKVPIHPQLNVASASPNACTDRRKIDKELILKITRDELRARGELKEDVLYDAVRKYLKREGYNGRGAKQLLIKLIASPEYQSLLSDIRQPKQAQQVSASS